MRAGLLLILIWLGMSLGLVQQASRFQGRVVFDAIWHKDGTLQLLTVKESVGQVPDETTSRATVEHLHFARPNDADETSLQVVLNFGQTTRCTTIVGPSLIIDAVVRPDGTIAPGRIMRNLDAADRMPNCKDVPREPPTDRSADKVAGKPIRISPAART